MSIIYCSIAEVTSEKLAVALILFDNSQVKFLYSENKLKIAKKLLSSANYSILKEEIHSLKKYYDKLNNKIGLFDFSDLERSLIHASIHLNNTIQIQAPITMKIEFNDANVGLIERKYLGTNENSLVSKDSFQKVFRDFKSQTSNNVSFDYKLTKDKFGFLDFPVKVSFAGRNGVFIFGNTLINDILSEEILYHKLRSIVDLNSNLRKTFSDEYKHYIMTDLSAYEERDDIYTYLNQVGNIQIVNAEKNELDRLALELIDSNCIPLEKYYSTCN